MSQPVTDSQIAVLCRQLQWELDQLAFDFPAGRVGLEKQAQLADKLERLAVLVRPSAHRITTVRSEADIRDMREQFVKTGDDPPAMNTAVRDTLLWVLGGIADEELIREYLVTGRDYLCFTCPAGWYSKQDFSEILPETP